jgi:hypothetical protein
VNRTAAVTGSLIYQLRLYLIFGIQKLKEKNNSFKKGPSRQGPPASGPLKNLIHLI